MPSVIDMLSLAVIAAITAGTAVYYYAFNNVEPQRNDRAQPVIQERLDQMGIPNGNGANEIRDDDNQVHVICQICGRNIVSEYVRTTLPCAHEFHVTCISDNFRQTAVYNQNQRQSTCPSCEEPYVLDDIQ